MHVLSPMETVCWLWQREQATQFCHNLGRRALTWTFRFYWGRAQPPKYFQGLRRKTVEQEAPRAREPMQCAGSCNALYELLIVCAWCQQHIGWQRVQTLTQLTTSHSICTRCYEQVSREIEH